MSSPNEAAVRHLLATVLLIPKLSITGTQQLGFKGGERGGRGGEKIH